MKQYTVRNVERYPTYHVLTAVPKSASQRLDYWPGQYAAVGFKIGGRLSPMRCFSMISSPHSEEIQFAMRPHGRFTKKVGALRPGDTVKLQGPFGNFVLDPSDTSIIMLAAGIGITPFLSMLRYAADTNLTTPITLLYGCRSRADIPLQAEIRQLLARKPNVRVAFLVQQGPSDPAQHIYAGRIDDALLQRVTGQRWRPFTYFICGPKGFTDSMQRLLASHQVDDDRIITESFTQATRLGWNFKRPSIPSLTYAATGAMLFAGIAFFMALDLVRVIPKTIQATAVSSKSAANVSGAANAGSVVPATTTAPSTVASPAPTAAANNTYSAPTYAPAPAPAPSYTQTYYQPPVSTVS